MEIYSGNNTPGIPFDILGESTEVKPLDVPSGSSFLELDTLDIYIFSYAKGWVAL